MRNWRLNCLSRLFHESVGWGFRCIAVCLMPVAVRFLQVKLHDVDPAAVDALVDFCYDCPINVDEKSVQALLPAACLLQMIEIKSVCCRFLERQLDSSNCLGIRAFADTHACEDLLRIADRFVQQRFIVS